MKIGVMMSGGLDSSILAAINRHHTVIGYGFEQLCNNKIFAQKICNILNIPFEHVEISNDDNNEVTTAVTYVSPLVDQVYVGINKTIDVGDVTYPNRLDLDYIKDTELKTNVRFPFYNLVKDEILQIGYDLVPEINDIIQYSHTCCASKSFRCNKCYNCKERKWAFSKLQREDHGKY